MVKHIAYAPHFKSICDNVFQQDIRLHSLIYRKYHVMLKDKCIPHGMEVIFPT